MNLSFKYELWELASKYQFINKTAAFLSKILYTKKIRTLANQENEFYDNLDKCHFDDAEQNIENMIQLGLNERLPRFTSMRTTLALEGIRKG